MRYLSDRTWIEIDLKRIKENYNVITKHMPESTKVMAVVKADCYGMGAVPIAIELEKAGCDFFAVTFIEEAIELRESGIKANIIVTAPIETEEVGVAAEHDLTISLSNLKESRELSKKVCELGMNLNAHIKIDSGLSRLGIVVEGREEQAILEVEEILQLPGLKGTGIYTHITAAVGPGREELDRRELELFKTVSDKLEKKGYHLIRHCLSSFPLTNYPEYSFEYVRIGEIIYGEAIPGAYCGYPVKNSTYLKSRVIEVKSIPCGAHVSYGPIFTVKRDTDIAIVPIGFADGLRRALSNTGYMIIHRKKVPIIGKICCDYTILDVTDIEEVHRNDIVTVIGREGDVEITPGDQAKVAGASSSEILTVFSKRIPRKIINS